MLGGAVRDHPKLGFGDVWGSAARPSEENAMVPHQLPESLVRAGVTTAVEKCDKACTFHTHFVPILLQEVLSLRIIYSI